MIVVLRLNADGEVVAANDAALGALGPCVGRRCCDVVMARSSDRNLVCGVTCGSSLASGGTSMERRGVRVRGRVVRLICAAADESPTVLIIEDGAEGAIQATLSPREAAVLKLVGAGQSDTAIASALGIQPSTVKTHLNRARNKLGAKTRAQAVAIALRSGLIA